MHYLKRLFILCFFMLSLLTSSWAALEKCAMNNDAIQITSSEIMTECHMDMANMDQTDDINHQCDQCHSCTPMASLQNFSIVSFIYPAVHYVQQPHNYTPPAPSFDTPPPRSTYL